MGDMGGIDQSNDEVSVQKPYGNIVKLDSKWEISVLKSKLMTHQPTDNEESRDAIASKNAFFELNLKT